MTAVLAPYLFDQFLNQSGVAVAIKYQMFTYQAGTTIKQPTYTDSTQLTQNPNPIVLDGVGNSGTGIWLDPTLIYKFVFAPPNDTDPPTSAIWTRDNVQGSVSIATITSAFLGQILYPQTSQEASVPVTPLIYVPSLQIDLERYGGAVGASAATNATALNSAIAVITKKGGGILVSRGSGTYTFTDPGASGYSLPPSMIIQGDGYDTTWKCVTAAGSNFLVTPNVSTGGRNEIRELQLIGPGNNVSAATNLGIGIVLGDSVANSGLVMMRKVLMSGWATALRLGGLIWGKFDMCEFGNAAGSASTYTNNVGIDFNFTASGNQVNALTFTDCIVSNNANNGVAATNVPITMNSIRWKGLTCQNNCNNTPTNFQFYMGNVFGFSIDDLYMESAIASNPPFMRLDFMQYGSIRNFFISTLSGTCTFGMRDVNGGTMTAVDIEDGLMQVSAGTFSTAMIQATGEQDIMVRNVPAGANTVTVSNSSGAKGYLATGSGLASWPVDEVAFTPAIAFAVSGSITQTIQSATYSRTGNTVTFEFRINWSAIAAPSGAVTITGFPIAPKSGGPDFSFSVGYAQGLTIPSGYLALFIPNGTTIGNLYNVQTTTAAMAGAAFAASGSIICSGSYQV